VNAGTISRREFSRPSTSVRSGPPPNEPNLTRKNRHGSSATCFSAELAKARERSAAVQGGHRHSKAGRRGRDFSTRLLTTGRSLLHCRPGSPGADAGALKRRASLMGKRLASEISKLGFARVDLENLAKSYGCGIRSQNARTARLWSRIVCGSCADTRCASLARRLLLDRAMLPANSSQGSMRGPRLIARDRLQLRAPSLLQVFPPLQRQNTKMHRRRDRNARSASEITTDDGSAHVAGSY